MVRLGWRWLCTEYSACNRSARNNFSGAIDGRPVLAYSLLNRGCSSLNASSVMARSECKGGLAEVAARGDVAEDVQLLLIFPRVPFFLSGCVVETSLILGAGVIFVAWLRSSRIHSPRAPGRPRTSD